MVKKHFLFWILVFALAFSSCTIEADEPIVATPALGSIPTLNPPTENSPQTDPGATTHIPVTWGHLNLTGRLVYIHGVVVDNVLSLQLQTLNLVTGGVTTIFEAPKYSWVYYISVSPDNTQVLMSYAPPPGDNPIDQDLYSMPLDGSQPPQLLFTPPTSEDDYIEVEPSPDGRYIYFTHVNYRIAPEPGQINPFYTILRMTLPHGPPEKIAEKAFWPRVSPDSSQIVYVTADLFTRGNKLMVADADGSNTREVVITGASIPEIKDAPIFSGDGRSIIISAEVPVQSYQPNWFEKLMGIHLARAHSNVPSDWWSVPVEGGEITRLTNIQSLGLFADRSPDNRYFVSYSLEGIFVMRPDGSELTMLLPNPQSLPGTVSWIP